MSAVDQQGFIIIWRTENVNFCRAHMECLISPKFVSAALQHTEWTLRLRILRKNMDVSSLGVILKRLDDVPRTMTVNIAISIVIPGRSEQELGKMKHVSFSKYTEIRFDTDRMDSTLSELFLDNMFTIRCHIFNPACKSVISEKCIAETRIGLERICFPWRIEKISGEVPKVISLYSSTSKSAHNLEGKGIKWLPSGILIIKIGRKCTETNSNLQTFGKISILDVGGKAKFVAENQYCFESEVDIWNFVIPANKSELLKQCKQLDDKLLMLCDFTFLSETKSDIVGHFWLLPAFQLVPETGQKEANVDSKAENKNNFPEHETGTAHQGNRADTSRNLKEDFKNLYTKRMHCDVILSAENRSIPCHKAILCSRSDVFKTMFDSQMMEVSNREVDIPDLDGDTLNRFLLYVYSETLGDLDWKMAKKLLYAADKYEIESLMADCSTFLKSQLTTSNVCRHAPGSQSESGMSRSCLQTCNKNICVRRVERLHGETTFALGRDISEVLFIEEQI